MLTPLLALVGLAGPALAAGKIVVSSSGNGHEILLDGVETGHAAPGILTGVSAGAHEVMVRSGCLVGRTTVQVQDDKTIKAQLTPVQAGGAVEIKVLPPSATLTVNGVVTPFHTTPVNLGCGTHSLNFTAEGFVPAVVAVDIGPDQVLPVELTLEKIGLARVRFKVDPADAAIFLNGELLDGNKRRVVSVPAGPHMIEARMDGYHSATQQLIVDNGDVTDVSLVLTPKAEAAAALLTATPVATSREISNSQKLRFAGIGLTAVGVGLGAYAVTQYVATGRAYDTYAQRVDEVNEDVDVPEAHATAYYENEIVPLRRGANTSMGIASALLVSGVTLTVAF